MRILQINNCHYRRGGADVVYLNTGDLLEKKGHDVFYFSQKNENNYPAKSDRFFIESIDFFNRSLFQKINLIPRFFYSKEAAAKLTELIKECKPQIVHIHTYKGTLTPSILKVLKKAKIPIVITLHDYGFLCPHNLFINGKMEICERCIKGSIMNCVIHKCNRNNFLLSTVTTAEFAFHRIKFPFDDYFNTMIAVSKFAQKIHIQSYKFKNIIKHLYNFYPELKDTNSNNSKGSYFLFFGRLSKEKGISTLIKSWMTNSRSSILKIVGTGELYDELKINTLGIDSIEVLGFKQGDELHELIKNASFIIVPSEWYENNPLTIIESYALGKPVIGANVGGITEIIENGKTGFLFEMKNIIDLSDKISMSEKMSEEDYRIFSNNSRQFAENHFNPDTHYYKLMKIYKETIDNYKKND